MTPLFAATQGATMVTSMSQSYDGTMAVDGAPALRATQTAQFVPTQELGMGGQSQSHDWMNPSSQVKPLILLLYKIPCKRRTW